MNYAKLNICSNGVWGVHGVPGAAPFGCLADAEQDTIDPHHDVQYTSLPPHASGCYSTVAHYYGIPQS